MANWRDDLKPIFEATAARNGWGADDRDFSAGGDIGEDFLPDRSLIFRALQEFEPRAVRFVILGQDPYADMDPIGIPHATGIAFAVDEKCERVPPSLRRIMASIYPNGDGPKDLCSWRKRHQVLLLNVALTVPRSNARSTREVAGRHVPFWRAFTTRLVLQVVRANRNAKLIAWGSDARRVLCDALEGSGAFTFAHHPSIYSGGDSSFAAFWDTPVGRQLGGAQ